MKIIHNNIPCWGILTYHAVEQFIKRWESDKPFDEAKDELLSLLSTSKKVEDSLLGDHIYVSGHRPEIRMVIKDRNICVTVLPKKFEKHNLQEEIEEINNYNQEKRNDLIFKIANIEKEIALIDEERKKLGDKKSQFQNDLNRLKSSLAKL